MAEVRSSVEPASAGAASSASAPYLRHPRRVSAGGVWAALMAGAMPARAPVMVPMAGAARRTAGSMVGVQVRVMATATTAMSPMMVE